MSDYKLLIVGDSPTVHTGFAEVNRNLAKRWLPHFKGGIDFWGINYNGWPYDHTEHPFNIYPAGFGEWTGNDRLVQLLNLISASNYTHLFILCDCHNLSIGNFPKLLRDICDAKKIHLTHYFPVDAQLEKEWLALAAISDAAVTYTEFGRSEVIKAKRGIPLYVLPHGIDTAT